MKTRHVIIALLLATFIGAAGWWLVAVQPVHLASVTAAANQPVLAATAAPVAPEKILPAPGADMVPAGSQPLPEIPATAPGKPKHTKPPIQDPAARVALGLVGADPDAEQYWVAAINDPDLPAEERKDLIEDLNEDGLSAPLHPGPEDVPLILNRLQLIEALAPAAQDPVNAAAFAEPYKDLSNLLAGEPVK